MDEKKVRQYLSEHNKRLETLEQRLTKIERNPEPNFAAWIGRADHESRRLRRKDKNLSVEKSYQIATPRATMDLIERSGMSRHERNVVTALWNAQVKVNRLGVRMRDILRQLELLGHESWERHSANHTLGYLRDRNIVINPTPRTWAVNPATPG